MAVCPGLRGARKLFHRAYELSDIESERISNEHLEIRNGTFSIMCTIVSLLPAAHLQSVVMSVSVYLDAPTLDKLTLPFALFHVLFG
jgi:hypothetical protein